jgi:hypothetical protein
MSSIRTSMTRFVTVARGETRLALAGAPQTARRLLVVGGWATLAISAGVVVGLAAVALPPMGLAGIIGFFAMLLLWVLPDGFEPPDRFIRPLLLVVVFVDLCLPNYYSIVIPGLPWISIRRLFMFLLIFLFALSYSASRKVREKVSGVVRENRIIFACVGGYILFMFLSLLTSIEPLGSINAITSTAMEWYVPFICSIYILRNEKDVETLLRLICWCGIIVTISGVIDYHTGKRIFITIMPGFMYDNMIATSDFAQGMLTGENSLRMGEVRVSGPYGVPLSMAEFEAMVAPFGMVLLFHGNKIFDRIFGAVVVGSCLVGIYVTGSRGGYLAFLTASFMFVALMVIRSRVAQPRALAAPLLAVVSGSGFVLVMYAILFVGRVRNVISGGGEGDSSNDARWTEWAMAWPKIIANPITGHGFGLSGLIVGYRVSEAAVLTVDSYLISLLTETGVPSVIFYFGTSLAAAWFGAKQYLLDRGKGGVWAGGLACSITGYTAYRFFLSQRENQTLFFILVGCVALLHSFYVRGNETRN